MYTYFEQLVRTIGSEYIALKHQGDRSDLQKKEAYLTLELVSKQFNLSKRTVSRYVRLNKLSDDLLKLVSKNLIAVRTGVELSYLNDELQTVALAYVESNNRITYPQSVVLHKLFNLGMLSIKNFEYVCDTVCKDYEGYKIERLNAFVSGELKKLKW